MNLRVMKDGDIPEAAQLMAAVHGEDGDPQAMEVVLRSVRIPVQFVFVAVDGKERVQGVVVWRIEEIVKEEFILDLAWLSVSPTFQGNGLGKALIQESIGRVVCDPFLRDRRMEYLTVEVDPDKDTLWAFYRKVFGGQLQKARVGRYVYLTVRPEQALAKATS